MTGIMENPWIWMVLGIGLFFDSLVSESRKQWISVDLGTSACSLFS